MVRVSLSATFSELRLHQRTINYVAASAVDVHSARLQRYSMHILAPAELEPSLAFAR